VADYRVLSDVPSDEDYLQFDRYTRPLTAILCGEMTVPPLTIGIFGPWGSGKSTVVKLVKKHLEQHQDRFLVVDFNPWIHRREPNMLIPLLHAIYDAFTAGKIGIGEKVGRLWTTILRVGMNVALKTVTAGTASIEDIEKEAEAYARHRQRAHSEMRDLQKTLEGAIVEELGDRKMVIFIDDLDRCDPLEIFDVLESIKLFLNVPKTFVVLAIDRNIVDAGIAARFREFDKIPAFDNIGAAYLEKIVQVPIFLHPLTQGQITHFLANLNLQGELKQVESIITPWLTPNPRQIKRLINNLIVAFTAVSTGDLDRTIVARLVILQSEKSEVFQAAATDKDYLLALEAVYGQVMKLGRMDDFLHYGDKKDLIREFCRQHYRPGSSLERIFKGAPFNAIALQAPGLLDQYRAQLEM
jgi:predicted KAP-like P-loop ATPase